MNKWSIVHNEIYKDEDLATITVGEHLRIEHKGEIHSDKTV